MICLSDPKITSLQKNHIYQITGRLKVLEVCTESKTSFNFFYDHMDPIVVKEGHKIAGGYASIEDSDSSTTHDFHFADEDLSEVCKNMVPIPASKEETTEIPFDAVVFENVFGKNLEAKECPIVTAQFIYTENDSYIFRMSRRKTPDNGESSKEIKYIDTDTKNLLITTNLGDQYLLFIIDSHKKIYINILLIIHGGNRVASALNFLLTKVPGYFKNPIRVFYRNNPHDSDTLEFVGIQDQNIKDDPSAMDDLMKYSDYKILQFRDFVEGTISIDSIKISRLEFNTSKRIIIIRLQEKDGKFIQLHSYNDALINYFEQNLENLSTYLSNWVVFYDNTNFHITALYPC